jgi:hypothetical protein
MADELMALDQGIVSSLVLNGDMGRFTPAQKVDYYNYRCQQAGLDPAAKPFDLLKLNGKEILYANAGATQQLTNNRKLSHQITDRELVDGIYCVFCRVTGKDGRSTENMGAVPVESLKGEAKANAMLKATTKAIRRSVLAHCGLGLMDETEVETIPGAVKLDLPYIEGKVVVPTEPTVGANPDDKLRPEPKPDPIVGGWTIQALEQFTTLIQNDLDLIFKDGGQPDLYNAEKEKWEGRKRTDPAEKVLPSLEARIDKLRKAMAKTVDAPAPTPAPAANKSTFQREADYTGDTPYADKARAEFQASALRFETAYKAQNLTDPQGLTNQMIAKVKAGIKFGTMPNETQDERRMMLADALQAEANLLRIP